MKNLITLLVLITFSYSGLFAQAAYQKAMGKALTEMGQAKTSADLQKVSNQFQRIASQKPTDWLPYYFQALALGRMSFMDQVKGDELADEAQKILNIAKPLAQINKDIAELETLQGFIYTAKLVVDPMSRGQMYSALSGKAYQKALQLDANNPRAKIMQIRGKLGAAQFFKQDLTPFVLSAQKLVKSWDDFTPTSRIHPNWGKEMAIETANMKVKKQTTTTEATPVKKVINTPSTAKTTISSKDDFSIKFETTLRNNKGIVRVSLQDNQKNVIETRKLTIYNKQVSTTFEGIAAGEYAIKYQHDENEDGKLNFGFMHIPTEGYGYSNDARGTMGAPDFKKTLFNVSSNVKLVAITKYH